MHYHAELPGWLRPIMPLMFVAWIAFIFFVLGRFGLRGLARVYPGGERPPGGRTFRWRSGRVGLGTRYDNCLNITVSPAGIYVVPTLLVRLFQPPVLLPWRGVRSVEEKRILFSRYTLIRFEDDAGWRVWLCRPAGAAAAVRDFSGGGDLL